jgi:hypothetical protein
MSVHHGARLGALLVDHCVHVDDLSVGRIDLAFEKPAIKIE